MSDHDRWVALDRALANIGERLAVLETDMRHVLEAKASLWRTVGAVVVTPIAAVGGAVLLRGLGM